MQAKLKAMMSVAFVGAMAISMLGCESGSLTSEVTADDSDRLQQKVEGADSSESADDGEQQIEYGFDGVWDCSLNGGDPSSCAFDGKYYLEGAYSLPALYSVSPLNDGGEGTLNIYGPDGNHVSGSYVFDSSDDFTLSFANGNVFHFSRTSNNPAEFECGFGKLEADVPFTNEDFSIEFSEATWVDGLTYEDVLGAEIASQIVEGAPSPLPDEDGGTYLVSRGSIENYTQASLRDGQEYEFYYLLNDETYIEATMIGFTSGEDAFLSNSDIEPMGRKNLYACCAVADAKVDEIKKASLFVVFHHDELPFELSTYIFEIPVLG